MRRGSMKAIFLVLIAWSCDAAAVGADTSTPESSVAPAR